MRSIIIVLFALFTISCSNNSGASGVESLDGYIIEKIDGSNVTMAVKKNAQGEIIEKGYLHDGIRNGVWLSYYEGEHAGKIKSIASYSGGALNGPYLELSNRGQIETEVNYANNQYNGKYAVYKFGRPQTVSTYKDNQLNGVYQEFSSRGNLQKEINYKDGKQHGMMRYYNEDGEVMVEYEYKNGEKVSGGMVTNSGDGEE